MFKCFSLTIIEIIKWYLHNSNLFKKYIRRKITYTCSFYAHRNKSVSGNIPNKNRIVITVK